ncbi:alcohol dehydrogenase [Kosmotoga arenicorallina S304]|uniref:Alcohol dehydrogenase n=1 Tax=Kosmotoga arenicorallina S304 TaxID=1453497 RepID=A0A182C757_9BACT|nr:iron-containing alcohol dehydrogenase family protein [Kosmotoga arenicorallina]OAA31287.1 alcohol dehydrogenase [Kosmotoga arenicorallina S304]
MWSFHIPTVVHFGREVVKKRADFVDYGSKAFIVTGRRSARASGALYDITKVLIGQNIVFTVFDEVEENPSFRTIEKGTDLLRAENCDFVIGIGGGSPIDAAKAIAILGANPEMGVEELYSGEIAYSLPLIAIPTTSGTGSEVTQYSVLTDNDGNKRGFSNAHAFPLLSFLDPRYTLTMPKNLTVSTALDALSHSVEGELINNGNNPMIKDFSIKATSLIREYLPRIVAEPENLFYREKLQYASMLAGIVIAHTGTTVVHAAGYPLSSKKGIRHGIANAVFLVDIFSHVSENSKDQVLKAIEPFESLNELSNFLNEFGVNNISISIEEKEISEWAEKAANAPHNIRTPGNRDRSFYEKLYSKLKEMEK